MSDAVRTRSRRLGRLCVGLFVASSLFPVVAGVLNLPDPPLILGIADIAVATMLVAVATVVDVGLAGRLVTGTGRRRMVSPARLAWAHYCF